MILYLVDHTYLGKYLRYFYFFLSSYLLPFPSLLHTSSLHQLLPVAVVQLFSVDVPK